MEIAQAVEGETFSVDVAAESVSFDLPLTYELHFDTEAQIKLKLYTLYGSLESFAFFVSVTAELSAPTIPNAPST